MAARKPLFLVAVDGSDGSAKALDKALLLAQAIAAKVVLAHVVDWPDYSFINAIEIDDRTRLREREETRAMADILMPLATAIAAKGIAVKTELRFGHPARTIAHLAEELSADMVVAGTRGRSEVASLFLGSFSHGLVQLVKRPLLLVP